MIALMTQGASQTACRLRADLGRLFGGPCQHVGERLARSQQLLQIHHGGDDQARLRKTAIEIDPSDPDQAAHQFHSANSPHEVGRGIAAIDNLPEVHDAAPSQLNACIYDSCDCGADMPQGQRESDAIARFARSVAKVLHILAASIAGFGFCDGIGGTTWPLTHHITDRLAKKPKTAPALVIPTTAGDMWKNKFYVRALRRLAALFQTGVRARQASPLPHGGMTRRALFGGAFLLPSLPVGAVAASSMHRGTARAANQARREFVILSPDFLMLVERRRKPGLPSIEILAPVRISSEADASPLILVSHPHEASSEVPAILNRGDEFAGPSMGWGPVLDGGPR